MPLFDRCEDETQLENSYSNRVAEALGATTLEPVTLMKGKTAKVFVLKRDKLYLSGNDEWNYRDFALLFPTQAKAENKALNNGYFIDVKN